jgi:hypothetical protein
MVRHGVRRRRREPEGIRHSLLCGGVVQLVRTPVIRVEFRYAPQVRYQKVSGANPSQTLEEFWPNPVNARRNRLPVATRVENRWLFYNSTC